MFKPIEQVKAEQEHERVVENNIGLFMNLDNILDACNSKNMEEFEKVFKTLNYYMAVAVYKKLESEEKLIKEKKDRILYVYDLTIRN